MRVYSSAIQNRHARSDPPASVDPLIQQVKPPKVGPNFGLVMTSSGNHHRKSLRLGHEDVVGDSSPSFPSRDEALILNFSDLNALTVM